MASAFRPINKDEEFTPKNKKSAFKPIKPKEAQPNGISMEVKPIQSTSQLLDSLGVKQPTDPIGKALAKQAPKKGIVAKLFSPPEEVLGKKVVDTVNNLPHVKASKAMLDVVSRPANAATTFLHEEATGQHGDWDRFKSAAKKGWESAKTSVWDSEGQYKNTKTFGDIIESNPIMKPVIGREHDKAWYTPKNLANSTVQVLATAGVDPFSYGLPKGANAARGNSLDDVARQINKTKLSTNVAEVKKPIIAKVDKPEINVNNLSLKQNEAFGKLSRIKDITLNKVVQKPDGNLSVNVLDNKGYNINLTIDSNGKSFVKATSKAKDAEKAIDKFIKQNPVSQVNDRALPVAVGQTSLSTARALPIKKPLKLVPNSTPKTITEVTKTEPLLKQRGFDKSIQESTVAPDLLKQHRAKNPMMYEPISNKATFENAAKSIENDFEGSLHEFLTNPAVTSADDVAKAEAMITRAIQNNEHVLANRLSSELAAKLTEAGRTVQAAAIFKRLDPEGMLMYAQRTVNRVNKEIEKNMGKLGKKVKLSEQETKEIVDRMTKAKALPEGREKTIELAKAMQVVTNKIPSTLVDKSRALRNIALLGNSKTFIRNITGNTLMGVTDNIANVIGAPIDKLISLGTKKRTTSIPSLITQAKGSAKGLGEAISDSFGGLQIKDLKGKTLLQKGKMLVDGFSNPINSSLVGEGKFETGRGLAFKNKPMRILENVVNTSLALGDKPFSQAYYDDVLKQLMKTNKVDVATQEMKEIAEQVAKERTYQDINSISSFLTSAKNLPKHIKNESIKNAVQIFVDSLVPYMKTPANILKRGVEYTPIGVIEGLAKLGASIRKGKLDMAVQREIVDRLSRGIVGSGLAYGGYEAAKRGMATGQLDKDRDVEEFQKATGVQPSAVKIGDKYINYNWAQPISMPFGAGVQANNAKKIGGNTILDAADATLGFYAEQPMLQSIRRLLGQNKDNKGWGQRLMEAGMEIPKQFIPSPLKQVAQLQDPNMRETYSPNAMKQGFTNQIKTKLPILSKTLPAKPDVFGNDVKAYQGDNSIFNVMFNPANITTEKQTPAQKEIMRLYNETGDKVHFPREIDKSFKHKSTTVKLTTDEYIQYQKELGKLTQQYFSSAMNTPEYKALDDKERVKWLQSLITNANEIAKDNILINRGLVIKGGN